MALNVRVRVTASWNDLSIKVLAADMRVSTLLVVSSFSLPSAARASVLIRVGVIQSRDDN